MTNLFPLDGGATRGCTSDERRCGSLNRRLRALWLQLQTYVHPRLAIAVLWRGVRTLKLGRGRRMRKSSLARSVEAKTPRRSPTIHAGDTASSLDQSARAPDQIPLPRADKSNARSTGTWRPHLAPARLAKNHVGGNIDGKRWTS